MTHPPATCELCGDTGLYSPSALPCPKGCKEFDIVQQANDVLQSLSDWAVTYAPDMCGDEMVKQAKARVFQQGTLAYIADATDKLRNVITALSEAEQREKDARETALEEAAKVAEGNYDHIGVQTKHDQCHHGKFEWEDCDQCVAAAIRALKNEVR